MQPILPKLAQRAKDKHGITIRRMSFWRLGRDMKEFAKIYNAAWSKNWGFQPYDKHDIADLAISYRLVFDKRWFMLAENDEEVVAAAITIPDINQVLKKMKGRVLPFGWWHYLNRKRIIDRCRVGFLGVLPEYEHTGVAALLYIENFDMAAVSPIKWGEPGWILETNGGMNRGLERMGGRISKRMRIYERLLEEGAEPAAPPESVSRYVPPESALERLRTAARAIKDRRGATSGAPAVEGGEGATSAGEDMRPTNPSRRADLLVARRGKFVAQANNS